MNEKWYGNYRAKVVDNKDPDKFGRVLVWVPDLMPELPDNDGIWARPANNPIGGRNDENDADHHYMGSSYIPKKGSWLFLFFEGGNPQRPYYFGSLDLENTKVLPENQLGSEYQHKWTILKSHKGRTIHISDDPDDERVEITGKKRNISEPPTGDTTSVYDIDSNQTVILLDERSGKEKLLIRTHKGDFVHIDIDEQKLQMYFKNDIVIQTDGNLYLSVAKNFIKEISKIDSTSIGGAKLTKVGGMNAVTSKGPQHYKSLGNINLDGTQIWENSGKSVAANPLTPEIPEGERDA